jgi:NADPH:quinone reductase-like Zn-dependent oxidoreductase
MSGTVAGFTDGVTGVAARDEDYGLIDFDRDGAAAEYVTIPASELAAQPRSVSHANGPAGPLTS